jgi:hypothetical protein
MHKYRDVQGGFVSEQLLRYLTSRKSYDLLGWKPVQFGKVHQHFGGTNPFLD